MAAAKKIRAPVKKKREREEEGELFTTLKKFIQTCLQL